MEDKVVPMNAASRFLTLKITSVVLLSFAAFIPAGSASYYEDWIVEAEVLEVLDEEDLADTLKQNPHLERDENFIGLKIKLRVCDLKEGHGRKMCKPGQEIKIAMNYKGEVIAGKIGKGSVLRIQYFYSNGRGAEGLVVSHRWELVEVIR